MKQRKAMRPKKAKADPLKETPEARRQRLIRMAEARRQAQK